MQVIQNKGNTCIFFKIIVCSYTFMKGLPSGFLKLCITTEMMLE